MGLGSALRSIIGSASPNPEAMAEASSKVQQYINENATVVFSKSYCPYCANTKSTLKGLNVNAEVIELDHASDGKAMQDALEEITGQRTVPNIFIGQKHVGGNSELQGLKKAGQLDNMLRQAGSIA